MMATMKAWRYNNVVGGIEKHMTLETDIPKPKADSLKQGQILIQTASVSLNPADYKVPELPYVGYYVSRLPTPCMDFSGRVTAVHSTSTSFKAGQRVFGRLDPMTSPATTGVLSEYIICNEQDLAILGDGVDYNAGASFGTVALTQYQAIQPFLKNNKHIFINGGSGGTGSVGIQIAKILGCTVTTSCSTPNIQFCKDLGADEVLDYKSSPILDQLKSQGPVFDHAVDNAGTDTGLYKNAALFLKHGAIWASVGGGPSELTKILTSSVLPRFLGGPAISLKMIFTKNDPEALQLIGKWATEKKLKAVIDTVYQFDEVPEAFAKLRKGRTKGKLIIVVNDLNSLDEE